MSEIQIRYGVHGTVGAKSIALMRSAVKLLLVPAPFAGLVRAVSAAPPAFEFSAEAKLRQQLVQVALGREPVDLIVRGATVLNVFTLSTGERHPVVW